MSSTLPFPEDDDPATRYVPPSDPTHQQPPRAAAAKPVPLHRRTPTTIADARDIIRGWTVELIRLGHQQRNGTIDGRTARQRRQRIATALHGLRLYCNIGEQVVVKPKDAVRDGTEAPKPDRIGELVSVEFGDTCDQWNSHVRLPKGKNSRHSDIVLLKDL